jgi:hypothetical protein
MGAMGWRDAVTGAAIAHTWRAKACDGIRCSDGVWHGMAW